MKEIKQSTEEGSLFSPLIEQMFDNNCKNTKEKSKCDKEIQTNISLMSFKTNECHKISKGEQKPIPVIDTSYTNSNLIVINPQSVSSPEQNNSDAIEDLFNILMHSPSVSDKDKKGRFQSPKKRKLDELNDPIKCETPSHFGEEVTHSTPANDISLLANCINTQSNIIHVQKKDFSLFSDSGCNDSTYFENESSFSLTENPRKNLDERLRSLAVLFGEESPLSEGKNTVVVSNIHLTNDERSPVADNSFSLPHDWKAEYAAQNCHLKILFSRLSSTRHHFLQKRFKELFGSERSIHTHISLNEQALSRKRNASIVVGELTPHYIAGRIASRDVFKGLAKKITDDFVKLPYVAGKSKLFSILYIFLFL